MHYLGIFVCSLLISISFQWKNQIIAIVSNSKGFLHCICLPYVKVDVYLMNKVDVSVRKAEISCDLCLVTLGCFNGQNGPLKANFQDIYF